MIVLATLGCGSNSDKPKVKEDGGGSGTSQVAPLVMPSIGIDHVKRMNFIYEGGKPAYEKAVAAYKAKPRDWAAVKLNAETALSKDPNHLDAHRLLGTALAQSGDHAAAVDHLVTAMAADYYKYGASIPSDEDLREFLTTPHGQAITALATKIKEDYARRVATGVWVVARRSEFKWATGVQAAASRGELYAFDRETKRYLRLTHTDHQVAGFVRAPAGTEVAILAFNQVDRPKAEESPPLLRAWVQVYDAVEWKPIGAKTTLPSTREVSVGYGAGDQLLVSAAPSTGRWTVANAVVSSVDRTTGKLTKIAGVPPEPRVAMSIEEGRLVRSADGVKAAWAGDPKAATSLESAGGAKIAVPESGAAAQATVSVAPTSGRIAFATAVDPCAKDAAPSLYVADGKTGALKHVLTAKSRFATRWIDANVLAYEDGEGAIRIWDASTGREAMKLDNKPGLALDVLSLGAAPLCKQAPPTVEPVGSGSDDALPPEEGSGGSGPVIAPQ
ncbi:MAG: hypothetical protein H0T79_21410 [Deltaproteobacteria bacterium]|nr:hypothetical protein [Deltaproteobacteria bacterium]